MYNYQILLNYIQGLYKKLCMNDKKFIDKY